MAGKGGAGGVACRCNGGGRGSLALLWLAGGKPGPAPVGRCGRTGEIHQPHRGKAWAGCRYRFSFIANIGQERIRYVKGRTVRTERYKMFILQGYWAENSMFPPARGRHGTAQYAWFYYGNSNDDIWPWRDRCLFQTNALIIREKVSGCRLFQKRRRSPEAFSGRLVTGLQRHSPATV